MLLTEEQKKGCANTLLRHFGITKENNKRIPEYVIAFVNALENDCVIQIPCTECGKMAARTCFENSASERADMYLLVCSNPNCKEPVRGAIYKNRR